MKFKYALAPIVITVLLAGGCVKTPSNEIVIGKNSELQEQWMVPAATKTYEAPSVWETQISVREGFLLEINAPVNVPEVDKYPVIAVAPISFPQEQIDGMVDTLFPGNRKFLVSEARTKEEIAYDIEMVMRGMEKIESDDAGYSDEEKRVYLEEQQAWLSDLQEECSHASDAATSVEISSLTDVIGDEDWVSTVRVCSAEGAQQAKVELNTTPQNVWDSRLMKAILLLEKPWRMDNQADKIDLSSQAEVTATANAFVQTCGLEQYTVNRIRKDLGFDGAVTVHMTKQYEGIPVTYAACGSTFRTEETETRYAQQWDAEDLVLAVYPNGIAVCIWISPSEKQAVVNENAAILPFDQIQKRAVDAFSFVGLPAADPEDKSIVQRRAVVTEIRLGYFRVLSADGGYLMIPVWDFFGYYLEQYASADDTQWILDENMEHKWDIYDGAASLLTLNAIDGSIVDRNLGY